MSYPAELDDVAIDNLLLRREFYSLKMTPERNYRDPPDSDEISSQLKISSYQLFVGNFINPNTPYKRLHLKFMTGGGKTLGALYSAHKFITVYRKMYSVAAAKIHPSRKNLQELDGTMPSVFVLGFEGTKNAFLRDLMKYPEFGFITLSEKEELTKRQNLASSGMPDDLRYYREYYSGIKKRITNKSRGGFFRFFGYDEFVNRIFTSDSVSLTDLEAITAAEIKSGRDTTLEATFQDYIARGKITVNTTMIEMFKNSLLICDEIHNTYNMNMKNNRGVAIQYILDSVPSVRFLSLSATPINNSPTEVIDWMNYLLPTKVLKRDFFSGRNLLPGKLEEIGRLLRGRVSFLQDVNIKYFPKSEFIGEEIVLPHSIGDIAAAGSTIPYLKFIPAPMSEFHQATLMEYLTAPIEGGVADSKRVSADQAHDEHADERTDERADENTDEPTVESTTIDDALEGTEQPGDEGEGVEPTGDHPYPAIPTDGYSIYDIAIPAPGRQYGAFRSSEVRGAILAATPDWREKNKISVRKFSSLNYALTGEFLKKENIGKYSTKYLKLLQTIEAIFDPANNEPAKCQKIMVYHDRVKMSGVLMIQELLRENGFIDEFMAPVEGTRCCICGRVLSEHSAVKSPEQLAHQFRPARFVIAHSDIDRAVMNQSLAKFNSPDNSHGTSYMILVGSKIIKESYDFKDIQHLILTSLPVNIPTFLQVIGRCIRKNSHINLQLEQRKVSIYILVSTINTSLPHNDEISPEIYRYVDKLTDYIIIQNIEREIIRNAIDADLNRDIIMPPDLRAIYFPNGSSTPINMLGNLYYEPARLIPQGPSQDVTFITGKYYDEEIRTICFILKRLFMRQSVWTYEQLWAQVRAPPMGVEVNPALFSENNFIIALENLLRATSVVSTQQQGLLLERLFDYSDKYIYVRGQKMCVEKVGKYYITFPVVTAEADILNTSVETREIVRDRERALIKSAPKQREHPLIDVEMYLRANIPETGIVISVDGFIADNRANATYLSRRDAFLRAADLSDDELTVHFIADYTDRFQIAFVEEAIIDSMTRSSNVRTAINTKGAKSPSNLYDRVLKIMDQFRALITAVEVRKYRDTAKRYKNGVPDVDGPIGYMTSRVVRTYDPSSEEWIEVNKIALNRQIRYKENEIIIGYFETVDDSAKFKLRSPVQKIDVKKATRGQVTIADTRLIERGIVCTTKSKTELLSIISKLGISASKLDRSEIRIKSLCYIVMRHLIDRELRERSKDTRYKFLYSWWDEMPDLTKIE